MTAPILWKIWEKSLQKKQFASDWTEFLLELSLMNCSLKLVQLNKKIQHGKCNMAFQNPIWQRNFSNQTVSHYIQYTGIFGGQEFQNGGSNMADVFFNRLILRFIKLTSYSCSATPKTPVCLSSCKSIELIEIRPPYWICHFEFCKSDLLFVFSHTENAHIPNLVQVGWLKKNIRHIEFPILNFSNLISYQ